MRLKIKFQTIFIEYLLMALGAMIMSAGLIFFLVPARIAPGGVSGLATVLYHVWGLPVGLMMLVFNIPLFLLGLKILGKSFGVRTLFAFTVVSLSYDFFDQVLHFQAATNDPLLAAAFGGIILGVGLGMVFRAKGTTGGSDILGQIIHKYSNISIGMGIMLVDFFVISFAGLIFGQVNLALYGFISLYASSKVIDLVIGGFDYARSLYIITDKQNEIINAVTRDLNRGGTLIRGVGFYTRQERNILFTVVTRKEVSTVRQIVHQIDPQAFVIISNVYEVLGEGFRPRV
ncbi:YitT family protein [candidate division KSB1 bacterium]|nr:YitT family protein [candidate division KSB1 bacterium]